MGSYIYANFAAVHLGRLFLRRHEFFRAQHIFRESLQAFRETGVVAGGIIFFTLEMFASLAVRLEDPERATRLFAWADAAREAWQNVRPTNEQKDVEQDIAAIRKMIDQETFDAAYAAGQAMTVEEAMAHALEKNS